eukprot:SAG11_NODE_32994_length_279_cov_1.444444_1_plen_44_part_10
MAELRQQAAHLLQAARETSEEVAASEAARQALTRQAAAQAEELG